MSSLLGQAQVIYTHTEVELLNLYFDDANQIPDYAKNAIASATVGNLVVNYPNIRPLSSNYNATPGKVAALIYQGLQKVNAMPLQEIAARFVIPPQFDYAQSFSEGFGVGEDG